MKALRTAGRAILGFVLVAALPAGARGEDVVRLGNMKFVHYGAIAYMKELGPAHGLKIEERIFAKGVDILPAMVAGEIDAGASGADAAIAGRASGVPIYVVAGFAKGGARIVAGVDTGIKTIKDLRGKRVGVTRGSAHEVLLFAQLEKHGLTWSDRPGKDVRVLYLGFADLNQALAAKQIEAMCQSEPQAAQALSSKIGVEVVRPYDTPMGQPVRTLVVTEKLYNERPAVARRLLELFLAATHTFESQPALAEKYVRERLFRGQLSAADYAAAMDNAAFTSKLDVAHIATTTELMHKYGIGRMTSPPRAADWVKLDLIEAARAKMPAGKTGARP